MVRKIAGVTMVAAWATALWVSPALAGNGRGSDSQYIQADLACQSAIRYGRDSYRNFANGPYRNACADAWKNSHDRAVGP